MPKVFSFASTIIIFPSDSSRTPSSIPSLFLRLRTVFTCPLRFITPSTKSDEFGTFVMFGIRIISLTWFTSNARSSSPKMKTTTRIFSPISLSKETFDFIRKPQSYRASATENFFEAFLRSWSSDNSSPFILNWLIISVSSVASSARP